MKKRLSMVYICISCCIVLAGCKVTNSVSEQTIEESSQEEILAIEEVVPYEDNVYISKFSKEDFYLLSVNEEFYENIALNPIVQKYEFGNGESTLDAVQKAFEACEAWNRQIDYTGAQLKGLLDDGEYVKLQEVINLWKEHYQEKVSLYQKLFGMNGMIPGSMYTEIATDMLADDSRLIACSLLSLEYELSQDIQFVIQSEEGNLNPENINWYGVSEESVCIEYSQDFKEILNSYSLDEKNSEELGLIISETAERIQEIIGDDFDFISHVNKYVSLMNTLNEIEEQISTDSRYIIVKEKKLKLYATQLLNIEFMLLEYCCF